MRPPAKVPLITLLSSSRLIWAIIYLLWFSLPSSGAGPDEPQTKQKTPLYAQIRLYNLRQAKDLATALQAGFPTLRVSAQTEELLIVTPSSGQDASEAYKSIKDLERLVGLLDLPRPQVTLQVWAVKVSSKDPNEIDKSLKSLKRQIEVRNLRIQKALQFGWFRLMARAQGPGFLDEGFREYVSKAFLIGDANQSQKYSLGYVEAFSPSKPSLATMLLCLAASKEPEMWVNTVVQDMENPPDSEGPAPSFKYFRTYLLGLVNPQGSQSQGNRQGLLALRAALADFLFQYKWAILYPQDFVPYDLQNSTTVLDSMFAPAVDALNRDIAEYIQGVADEENWQELTRRGAKTQLASRGIIKVAALSGSQATVEGKTTSYFDITTPPSLAEIVKGVSDSKSDLTALFPKLPAGIPGELLGALAAISGRERAFVQIDKGMKLVITPTTLATASSAELNIDLKGGDENGQPTVLGSDKNYTVDRIAKHDVTTTVRVESLKLFEVSSFSFNVLHPQPDGQVPVIGDLWNGIFGAVPGVGRLFKWHRAPAVSAHRSLAIISALIVPTSMDLALGIRVESDRKLETDPKANGEIKAHTLNAVDSEPLLRKARPFHKKKMECLLSPPQWMQFEKAGCTCENLKFECVPADYRDELSPASK